MNPQTIGKTDEIFKLYHELNKRLYTIWKNEILFTWQWWLLLALSVLPWIIWYLIRDKESTGRLLYAGFCVMVISTFLDFIGIAAGLWEYPLKLIPFIQSLAPWNVTLLPVVTMITLQFMPRIRPLIKAVIYSASGSFILQPVSQWLGLYKPNGWKDYYSFPVLITIYLISNFLVSKDYFKKLRS